MAEKYFEDYIKMKVLREVAKDDSNGIIAFLLKTLDKGYNKEFKNLIPPKKKVAFVTKF